jgi:hypothetical protein
MEQLTPLVYKRDCLLVVHMTWSNTPQVYERQADLSNLPVEFESGCLLVEQATWRNLSGEFESGCLLVEQAISNNSSSRGGR